MRLLLLSLKAIKWVCGQEKFEKHNASCDEKASHSENKDTKRPGTEATARVPKKARAKKHCDLCTKHGGTYTMYNTCYCCRFETDVMEKI